GDVDALEAVDFLDFVDQVSLQLFFAEHGQDVVGVERAVHERFAGLDALAFLHVDVNAAGNRVFLLSAVVGDHVDLALALGNLTELDRAVNLADDGGLVRLAGFEELDHARQTTGDVFGFGGFARNLGQHIAGADRVAVLHHEVGPRGHEVALAAFAFNHNRGLALLVGGIADDVTGEAGDFVHFFVEGDAFLQVL